MIGLAFIYMIILAKLELTLLMIVTAHVLVVLRLWFTFIVLFSLTALYEPSASQNCSPEVLSHSSHLLESEYIFYDCSWVLLFTCSYS